MYITVIQDLEIWCHEGVAKFGENGSCTFEGTRVSLHKEVAFDRSKGPMGLETEGRGLISSGVKCINPLGVPFCTITACGCGCGVLQSYD